VPDWVIRAQFGHVSPAMMAVYSHVRRKALEEAAKALEPETKRAIASIPESPMTANQDEGVTSQVTSQSTPRRNNVIEFPKESGAPCRTRTCDLLVRSQPTFDAHRGRPRKIGVGRSASWPFDAVAGRVFRNGLQVLASANTSGRRRSSASGAANQ
jgi:hypothetical protein